MPADIVIHDLPSLQETVRITPQSLGPGLIDLEELLPAWGEWDPASGALLAIAWSRGSTPAVMSFHDAATGKLVSRVDFAVFAAHLAWEEGSPEPRYIWSPSGAHILVAPDLEADDTPLDFRPAVVGIDGNCHALNQHPDCTVVRADGLHVGVMCTP